MHLLLITSIELGLLYSLVVLGIFLTFRILNFPDLTVDGSFVTGAVTAAIAIRGGIPGVIAILLGFLAGVIVGGLTAVLHIRLGIGKILSGILSLGIAYTINLRLMGGPNASLLNHPHIVGLFKTPFNHFGVVIFLLVIVVTIKILMDWFLQTELGLWLRATGINELTAPSFSINIKLTKFIGISLSNGLVGMAGSLVAQYQGFSDINMGAGIIVLGLAALMLGEALIPNGKISVITLAVIIGALLYQLIINVALRLGLAGTDIKLVTAGIVIISLVLRGKKNNSFL